MIVGQVNLLNEYEESVADLRLHKFQRVKPLHKVDKFEGHYNAYFFRFHNKEEIDELVNILKKFKKDYEDNYE